MTVIYATGTKTRRMDAITAAIDAGAGAGKLLLGTAAMAVVLASFTLEDPAAAGAVNGVLTLVGPPKTVFGLATGVLVEARVEDSNGNAVITGLSVGLSGADIIVDSTTVTVGVNVVLNSATITHAT